MMVYSSSRYETLQSHLRHSPTVGACVFRPRIRLIPGFFLGSFIAFHANLAELHTLKVERKQFLHFY